MIRLRLPRFPLAPAALSIGPAGLLALAETDDLRLGAAVTARFYGGGIAWALALPVHELFRWNRLMRRVWEIEHGR